MNPVDTDRDDSLRQAPAALPRLLFHLPLDPARLLRARQRIRDYLHEFEVDQQVVDDVVLAVQEAMTNAVCHSGAGDDLEVSLFFEGSDLIAEVRDHGRGFDVARFDPQALPDLEEPSGRGLYLMARLMDELTLRVDGGLQVRAARHNALPVHFHNGSSHLARGMLGVQMYRDARETALLDEIEEEYFAFDWEYRLVHANAAVTQYLGKSLEELLGRTVWDLLSPAAEPLGRRVEQAMQFGRPGLVEYPSRLVPGRWLEARVYPASFGLTVFSNDITERKLSELAHEESRRRNELLARTAALLLSADDPRAVVDDLCREVMQHLRCEVFFSYLLDEERSSLSLNAWAGVGEHDVECVRSLPVGAAVCGLAAAERRRVVAEDIQHRDDPRTDSVRRYGIQAYAAHPLVVHDRVAGTLSFGARDRASFTEEELALMRTVADYVAIAVDRQRAQMSLEKSEELLRAVVDNIRDSVIMRDLQTGRCLLVNAAEEEITGFSAEEIRGLTLEDIYARYHPDDRLAVLQRQALVGGLEAPSSVEYRWKVKSGEYRWLNYRRTLLHNADGTPKAIISLGQDITERKRREANLTLLADLARESAVLSTADEIMAAVGARLARHLEVAGVAVFEIAAHDTFLARAGWSAAGVPPLMGVHKLSDFLAGDPAVAAQRGSPVVVRDAVAESGVGVSGLTDLGVRSLIGVPFSEDGGWWQLFVATGTAAREWREDEVELVRDVATMTLPRIARAHAEAALRESQAKYRLLYDVIDEGYLVIDVLTDGRGRPADLLFVEANAAATAMLGADYTGRYLSEIGGERDMSWVTSCDEVARTGTSTRVEYYVAAAGRWCDCRVFKIGRPQSRRVGITFTDVTERRAAEAERESLVRAVDAQRGRLQAIVTSLPVGLWSADASGTVDFVNEKARAMWGATEAASPALVAAAQRRSYWPDTDGVMTGADQPMARALAGETVSDLTVDVERFDGTRGTQLLSAAPICAADGAIAGAVVAAQDVTEHRRALAALRASEERLTDLLRAAGAGVWDWDAGRQSHSWSRELYEIFGLDPARDPATLENWAGIVHPDDRERMVGLISEAMRSGHELNAEYRILRDGEVRWLNALGRARYAEGGELLRMGGISIDITERKRLEEQVARQEQQARHMIRNAPAAIYEIDFRGPRFVRVNEYTSQLSGYIQEELLCMSPLDLLAEEDRGRFLEDMQRTLAGLPVENLVDYRFRTKQGEERKAVLNVSPLVSDGAVNGAFVVAYDVTERARAEDSLRASARRYRGLFESLQEGFVHPLPQVPGLDVSALSLPAHRPELIGGDFHDVFVLPDGRVMAMIGDVMGKGVRAAGLTETVRSAARILALDSSAPEQILDHVNRLLLRDEYQQFVSALIVVLDPATGRCRLASAGHPAPLLFSAGRGVVIDPEHGPLLGVVAASYPAAELTLPAEAALVLYTDGLTEARHDGELFGEARLLAALAGVPRREPQALADRLHAAVLSWAGELKDDLEILVLRRTP